LVLVVAGIATATDSEMRVPVRAIGFRTVYSVAFSPDGRYVAIRSEASVVHLVETERWTVVRTLEGQTSSVRSVAFSPDGELLASWSVDHTVRLWLE
jgi:WD40 repeat protein